MSGPVRVGLLGCGGVGTAVARLVEEHADLLTARAGVAIEISRVAVRDTTKQRDVKLPADRFTDDAAAVVADPNIDVVVEVMGGSTRPARSSPTRCAPASR